MSRDGPFKAGAPETTDEQGAEASSPSTRSPIVRRAQRRAAENDCDEQSEHECTVHDRRAGRRGEQGEIPAGRARDPHSTAGRARDPHSTAGRKGEEGEHDARSTTTSRASREGRSGGRQGGAVGRNAKWHEIPTRPQGAEARAEEGEHDARSTTTSRASREGRSGGRQRGREKMAPPPPDREQRGRRGWGMGNGDSGSAVGDRVSRLGLCRESSVGPALLAEGFGPFN
jgi:hypothetical protein